jgi:hypothetical protein
VHPSARRTFILSAADPTRARLKTTSKRIRGPSIVWLGGHTHTHPDDTYGGKSHIETKWGGTHFINVACLSRFHGPENVPKSRLLTFAQGSDEVRVQCYMHSDEFLPQGWYQKAERVLKLARPFSWT